MRQSGTAVQEVVVRLVVQDTARSKRFYSEVLGLIPSPNPDGNGWSCAIPDGRRLVVRCADSSHRRSSQGALTIELPGSQAVIASHILARIAGGEACSPVRISGRWTASLIDPDGHVVRVTEMNRVPGRAAVGSRLRVSRRASGEDTPFRPTG